MSNIKSLSGIRVLSLALNLPGPAALMRMHAMGAHCTKLQGPAGDPMGHYNPGAYGQLSKGVKIITADLKTLAGQRILQQELAKTDVLLSSFRPSAITKLGLGWRSLHKSYPALSHIAIVGSPGVRAEEPGHDLTYLAENGLINGLDLPPTLYADMAGSLMAVEAVLQAVISTKLKGKGVHAEVALSSAAAYLALPRSWGLTTAHGAVGGAHAGYRVYACQDGRVAVAALEPHFARALCEAAGIAGADLQTMFLPATHQAIARYLAGQTRAALEQLATQRDIPLHTMAP
jgi:alpha-methylacyl-CoA racemase